MQEKALDPNLFRPGTESRPVYLILSTGAAEDESQGGPGYNALMAPTRQDESDLSARETRRPKARRHVGPIPRSTPQALHEYRQTITPAIHGIIEIPRTDNARVLPAAQPV